MYGDGVRYLHELDEEYKVFDMKRRWTEEWPSETYNYQDRFSLKNLKSMKVPNLKSEDAPSPDEADESEQIIKVSKKELKNILRSVNGLGKKKYERIIKEMGGEEAVVGILEQSPDILLNVKGITEKMIENITLSWENFKGEK
jgi:DNA uptake protein ComE-like DNA-binding protein